MKQAKYRMEAFRQKNVQEWRKKQFQATRQGIQTAMNAESMKQDAMNVIQRFQTYDIEEINIIKFYKEANKKLIGGAQLNLDVLCDWLTNMWVNLTYHIDQYSEVFDFCNLYAHQSTEFFEKFIRSLFYFEMVKNLDKGDIQYKVKILSLVNSMNDIRKHEISIVKLYDCLNQHIKQLEEVDGYGDLIKQLILMLVNCALTLRQEQMLICLLNSYIILLLENGTFERDEELVNYIHFISTKKSIFDAKTFELLETLAFDKSATPDEKAAAIGVIGQLMSGNHRQVMYYYESLSKAADLFHRLLITLLKESPIVKISSAYAIANILSDKQYPLKELYERGCIWQLFIIMDVQWELEVQVELLRAYDMIVQNSEFEQISKLVNKFNMVEIVKKIDHIQIYELMYTCLHDLLMRFQQHSEESKQQIIQMYKKQGAPQIIATIYNSLPAEQCTPNLEYLHNILQEK